MKNDMACQRWQHKNAHSQKNTNASIQAETLGWIEAVLISHSRINAFLRIIYLPVDRKNIYWGGKTLGDTKGYKSSIARVQLKVECTRTAAVFLTYHKFYPITKYMYPQSRCDWCQQAKIGRFSSRLQHKFIVMSGTLTARSQSSRSSSYFLPSCYCTVVSQTLASLSSFKTARLEGVGISDINGRDE